MVLVASLGRAGSGQSGPTSLTLEECITIALENNHDIRAARLSTQSALSDSRGSLSSILPTLNDSAGYSNQATYFSPQFGVPIPGREYYSAGLYLTQNIFDGGKWWNQISEGRNRYEYAFHAQLQTKVAVVLRVKRTFYQYLRDVQLVEVAAQAVRLAEQQVTLVRRQYEVEAVARSDLLKQQVRLGELSVDLMNQKTAMKNSFNELANAMGLSVDSGFSVVDSPEVDGETPVDVDAVKKEVREHHPGLVAKRTEMVGSELRVKLAKADYFPSLSASVSYDGSSDVLDQLYSDPETNWGRRIRLSLSLPIFSGLTRTTQVSRAEIDRKVVAEEYERLVKDVEVQLDLTVR
ncbi:MAG: TolC family protein, partial [Fidelibacterota bacterium]